MMDQYRSSPPPVGGERVGEIVEASSRTLIAQSVRLHAAPPFGSLVRVPVAGVRGDHPRSSPPQDWGAGGGSPAPIADHAGAEGATELYAVVTETRTASLEAGGRPIARGHEDVVDAAIYRENPDLEHVLRTEFRALLVGYGTPPARLAPTNGRANQSSPQHWGAGGGNTIRQHLPPLPPPLHYSVYACTDADVVAFTERLDYLRALLAEPPGVADELVAASVRAAAAARPGAAGQAFLLRVGRELAALLRDDYDRLTALLRRLSPDTASPAEPRAADNPG